MSAVLSTNQDPTCGICLEEFKNGEQRWTHEGGQKHSPFHKECLGRWLQTRPVCPHDRTPINPSSLNLKSSALCERVRRVLINSFCGASFGALLVARTATTGIGLGVAAGGLGAIVAEAARVSAGDEPGPRQIVISGVLSGLSGAVATVAAAIIAKGVGATALNTVVVVALAEGITRIVMGARASWASRAVVIGVGLLSVAPGAAVAGAFAGIAGRAAVAALDRLGISIGDQGNICLSAYLALSATAILGVPSITASAATSALLSGMLALSR